MEVIVNSTTAPLKPAVVESIVSLIEERTAPRPQESREYTLTILLLGTDDSSKTQLFELLREYFQIPCGEKGEKGNSLTVASFIDSKQLCLKIINVPEKGITRIRKDYPLTSACVFVCDLSSDTSITFMKAHVDEVTVVLKEESGRLQSIYNAALLPTSSDPSSGLTLDTLKRAMTAPRFVPHILVVCNVENVVDQQLKAQMRDFVFDRELRWAEVVGIYTESIVRSVLCLARGVADDYDFIDGASWDNFKSSADKQGGCSIM
ncbi:Hypothetical protein GLP15_3028 [Giardia lamblia P15]|uniref:Uncharacterized protein n=1 Tax=Giardia intestinalis (strain P15) TaxID=658858 RepID=E1F6N5_GIAIA|nr:Hypothetical protein GLP15_3028 [Giardia lamblia P15]